MKIKKQRARMASRQRRFFSNRLSLQVQYATQAAGMPRARVFKHWVRWALQKSVRQAKLTLRIVDHLEGQNLNHRYRGKNYATNVLSFNFEPVAPLNDKGFLVGDLVLTAPVIMREAAQQGTPLIAHYAHLVVHGLLHLQGFDHHTDAEAHRMETLESAVLKQLGYDDPYGEESS